MLSNEPPEYHDLARGVNLHAPRDIADYNEITDPRKVAPGTRLVIPPRRLEAGRFESV